MSHAKEAKAQSGTNGLRILNHVMWDYVVPHRDNMTCHMHISNMYNNCYAYAELRDYAAHSIRAPASTTKLASL